MIAKASVMDLRLLKFIIIGINNVFNYIITICRIKIQNLPQICIPTIAILAFTVLMVFAIIPYGLKMGWKSVLAGNRLDAIRSIINQRDFVTVFLHS